MSGLLPSRNTRLFRYLVVGTGLCWAIAFVPVALAYQLELYGDGAMFSYAVAVRDVWAFHWHNISGRSSVFLFSLWPAEALVRLTGSPWAGILTYGFLFDSAPLIGLILTWVTDRSPGRTFFVYACASTALLCPLVFGFPTEMWLAQAAFWPTLAISHYASKTPPAPHWFLSRNWCSPSLTKGQLCCWSSSLARWPCEAFGINDSSAP